MIFAEIHMIIKENNNIHINNISRVKTKIRYSVKDLPLMLLVFHWWNLALLFKIKRVFKISQSETRIACNSHVCSPIGTKQGSFCEGSCIDAFRTFGSIWSFGFTWKDFLKYNPIRNKKEKMEAKWQKLTLSLASWVKMCLTHLFNFVLVNE